MTARRLTPDAGFMVVELLMAMTVIVVGLLATVGAFQHGLSGIETGRAESAATFLVEHKLEELKALALLDWTNAELRAGTVTEYCRPPDPGCSALSNPPSLRRTTTIADVGGTCATQCKAITVAVFYRAVTTAGQLDQERRVDATTMFVARP